MKSKKKHLRSHPEGEALTTKAYQGRYQSGHVFFVFGIINGLRTSPFLRSSASLRMMRIVIFRLILVIGAIVFIPWSGTAAPFEDLRKLVEQKNQEIQKLQEEAKKYRSEIALKQELGKTLKNELTRIEQAIGGLQRDIAVTEKYIEKTQLEIQSADEEIAALEQSVARLRASLKHLLNTFSRAEDISPLSLAMGNASISDIFRLIDYHEIVRKRILSSLAAIRLTHGTLSDKKAAAEEKKATSEDFKATLEMRRSALAGERKEQASLLSLTRLQEKTYQTLLNAQERRRASLEQEIHEIEEKIRITIDPSSLPLKGRGVLGPPMSDISPISCWNGGLQFKNCITQFFGHTSFAAAGGYGGKGHNGADFRAEVGSLILAAERGIVEDTGDTDQECRGASYGRWVLIRHPNNLTTLYAHLSQIAVVKGQDVKREGMIGLAGKSGYATGPHLHFSVFATQGVRIEEIRSKVCGTLMKVPIAAINAYLNPLDYL